MGLFKGKTIKVTSPLTLLLGLMVLSISINSCRLGQPAKELVNSISVENLTNNQKLIENATQGIRLTVPSSWSPVETLRPDADIYAANEADDLYVLVLADNQDSLVGEFSLEDNSSQYRRTLARPLDEFDGQTPTDVTSVNGQPAVQYEIRGRIDNVDIVYLHTTIRGEVNYYQVVGWTRADRYDKQQPILQEVITSFRGS